MYREKILTILVFLIGQTSIFFGQSYSDISQKVKVPVFTESFDSNNNQWFLENQWLKGKINNGIYDIICKNYQKATGISYKPVLFDNGKDYEIETSIKILHGSGGLIFGMNKNFDHYRIEISENKLVILKNTPSKGKNEELFSGTINLSINSVAFNKITVRKLGERYVIYFNENYVGAFNNIKPEGDLFGFNAGLNSEISVDYLNISLIQNQTSATVIEKSKPVNDTLKNLPLKNEGITSPQGTPATQVDPIITWTSPSSAKTPMDLYTARVKATILSESELTSVMFFVNGTSKGEAERTTVPGETGVYHIEKSINLEPGENSVYFLVTNLKGSSKRSDDRYFINPEATKPVITWGIPEGPNVVVESDMLTIEACITSPSGLKSVNVMVNGESQGEEKLFQLTTASDCNIRWKRSIILKEGADNSVYIIATNDAGPTPSEKRIIRYSKAIVQTRLALVIGNSNYGTKTPLMNPIPDANLMEGTLKQLGFTVIKYTDLDLLKMKSAIRDFCQKMKDYNVALFYYAGHGVQVDGQNFLIPVDAKLESKDDCKWETFAVNDLMEEFEKNPKNINIAILDACRSNPFKSWARGAEASFIPLSNTSGTFVSFATAPGSTAADGSTGNGLFTEELVKQMNIAQPISSVFLNTRMNVWERSRQTQRPQEWNDLNGEFYFKK